MSRYASPCSVSVDIRESQKVLLPSPHGRHLSVPNFSRIISAQKAAASTPRKRKRLGQSAMLNPGKVTGVKRWDAKTHQSSDWDGLRRDDELWQPSGDCLVHLYGQGKSKRGASFRVSYSAVKAASSSLFLEKYLASDVFSSSESSDSTAPSTPVAHADYELYIPVPLDVSREDAYRWHITTRNFFAYIANKPLVGVKLGSAMIDLLERIHSFCPNKAVNIKKFLLYARQQGYSNFVDYPAFALAFLNFAERFRLRELWIDAFAHCVGMNDQLDLNPEFEDITRVTKALITRAFLEMDLHLGRVSRALRNFLEDELSSTYLGLPSPARSHLDRFRSFLQSYYVNKFGYWPPEQNPVFSKTLLRSMQQEFQMLYDYLADCESSPAQNSSKLLTGGICVSQNVDAFNLRHHYEPLPHPLPLVPDCQGLEYRTSSQRGLRSLRLSTKLARSDSSTTARSALSAATNTPSSSSALVRNYMYFERELTFKPDEKLSVADARKVRWIAIYSILQMLTNAVRAPREVSDADDAPYHLCLLTTGTPHWSDSASNTDVAEISLEGLSEAETEHSPRHDSGDESVFSIHPDCEDDDYFSHKTTPKRVDSLASLRPPPLRISTASPVGRTSSIRTLHRSLTSSFAFSARRNSVRSSVPPNIAQNNSSAPTSFEFTDLAASKRFSGYSFAINEEDTLDYLQPQDAPKLEDLPPHYRHHPAFEARTPILDVFMLDPPSSDAPSTPMSSSSSSFSPVSASSRTWGNSSDDMDASSWDDRRSSKGIYSMDHESVCGDMASSRKASGPNSPNSGSPTSSLLTLTASSAAATTAKLLNSHIGLTSSIETPQQMPSWWGTANERSSPRTSLAMFGKQRDLSSLAVSVPQDVPEDHVLAFETYSRSSESDLESTVDIFDALHLLPV